MMHKEPTLGDLLKDLRDNTTALVREEVALAKTEIAENVKRTATNTGYLAGGGLVAFVALILLLMAVAKVVALIFIYMDMNRTLAEVLGYAGVATAVGLTAAVLIAKALQTLKDQPLLPKQTIETLKEDKEWAQQKVK